MQSPSPDRSREVGIIGHPLGHSVSPAFQQAAFDHLRLQVTYQRWPTPPEMLLDRVWCLRNLNVLGANVTVPHKETVIPLLDDVDPLARRIGAVNTIVSTQGRLAGHNTDAAGFIRSLSADGGFDPLGKTAWVLGAGGAARAVVFALSLAQAKIILICNRTASRAESLAQAARGMGATSVSVLPWGETPSQPDLIVNTTTLGMRGGPAEGQTPVLPDNIPAGALVCDLVYNPAETPLLAAAGVAGARRLGGLPMLVYQGTIAFELWTGLPAPVDVMFAAARSAL